MSNRSTKRKNLAQANREFPEALGIARRNGLELRDCGGGHYQLWNPDREWLLNIRPSTQFVRRDINKPQAPRIELPNPWTLTDVVTAMVDSIAKLESRSKK